MQEIANKKPFAKILVSCHKHSLAIDNGVVAPITVGASLRGNIEGIALNDNSGTNISHLNDKFCELSAQYYAYKNITADWYGFFHYRRYLSLAHIGNDCKQIVVDGFSSQFESSFGLTQEDIKRALCEVDLVLPQPLNCKSVYEHFRQAHTSCDLDFCIDYIKGNYPEFCDALYQYLNGGQAYYYNMFVARADIFCGYCQWLFDILFAWDSQKDYSNCTKWQMRMAGFLGERLLGVYVHYLLKTNKTLKVSHAPVVYIKDTNLAIDYKIKSNYKDSTLKKIADRAMLRGTRRRELAKRMYLKFVVSKHK